MFGIMNIVETIASELGGQRKLADYLGVKPQAVTQWIRSGRFPPERAIQMERKSEGQYKAVDLLPESKAVA
jgi:DNA-binding transcriptional regulator YdaS (Cro superfamily)